MPSYTIPCPQCNEYIKADETLLGQAVDCPICEHPITIPTLEDLQQDTTRPDGNNTDSSTNDAPPSTNGSKSRPDETIDKADQNDTQQNEDEITIENTGLAPPEDLDRQPEKPDKPADTIDADDERSDEKTEAMSLTAFREYLRNRNTLDSNLANADFSAKLQSEASKTRSILES